ncbi:MAG: hypothetical protein ACFB22_05830 [Rhodothalassiaceae bacterium]
MRKPLSFIHIGLPKCGSTFLQNIYSNAPNTATFALDVLNDWVAKTVSEGGQPPTLPRVSLPAELVAAQQQGKTLFASTERLSVPFLHQADIEQALPAHRSLIARTLAHQELSDHIWLMVRDPIAWIRSMHTQSIKQGAFDDAQTFLARHWPTLQHGLDLEGHLEVWTSAIPHLLLTPLETLQDDEEATLKSVEAFCGAPAPPAALRARLAQMSLVRNRSFKQRLPYLAAFNRQTALMKQAVESLPHNQPDLSPFVQSSLKLGLAQQNFQRFVAETIKDADFTAIVEDLQVPDAEAFAAFRLDQEQADWIAQRFLRPLTEQQRVPAALASSYADSLHQATHHPSHA